MIRHVPLAVIALALAGCGSGPVGNSTSPFDKGFVDAYRPKFVAQCQAGAQRTSRTTKDFSVLCGCMADKLIATKSAGELMSTPPHDEIEHLAVTCAREHPPT